MIKNISKYINVFKRPKSLKMKAKDAYGSFKRKTVKTAEKVKSFAKNNPNKTVIGGALAFGGITTAIDGKSRQNLKIEMQKIDKEVKSGKNFSSKQIKNRLKKAEKSKREFTWF